MVAPMTMRICRIDLRMASRKARLASSIRCQRPATGPRAAGPLLLLRHISPAGDDRDRGVGSEPRLGGRGLIIRQQGDYPVPFQVADDAGVSMIAPLGVLGLAAFGCNDEVIAVSTNSLNDSDDSSMRQYLIEE